MLKHLNDAPVLSVTPCQLDAKVFNTLRLATLRLKTPIRLMLPGLRAMDIVIDHRLWVVVDRALDDLPIVAWDQFDNRNAIHSPVACRMRCFHFHAATIATKALLLAQELVSRQMEHAHHDEATA